MRQYSAKETCDLIDPTDRSHPMGSIDMGWLRSVGSIKLYVSFAEYCLFCRALLQKRPMIFKNENTKKWNSYSHSRKLVIEKS